MYEGWIALQARVLAFLAWADGSVHADERRLFSDALEAAPITDAMKLTLSKLIEVPPEEHEVTREIASAAPAIRAEVLRTAYLMASADGVVDAKEWAAVDSLGRAAGLSDPELPQLREMLMAYGRARQMERQLFRL